MRLPASIFAGSLKRQRTAVMFRVMVFFVVVTTALAIAVQAILMVSTAEWDRAIQARLTIEIPAPDDEVAVPYEQRVQEVVAVLKAHPALAAVRVHTRTETEALLARWVHDQQLLAELPLPTIIEVIRKDIPSSSGQAAISADDVRSYIKNTFPKAAVDDHALWMSDGLRLKRGAIFMALFMAVLAMCTLVASVGLFSRNMIAAERDTLCLLRIMGADDHDMAQHFARLCRGMAVMPAVLAAGMMLPILMGGGVALAHYLQSDFLNYHTVLLGLGVGSGVVLGAIGLTEFVARFAVRGLLLELP